MPDTTSKPMKEANPSQEQLDPEKNYKMDVLRKGHMFILNMGKDRKGSDVDVRNIEHVFMEIGFEIETHSDLTAKELRDKLETFVNSPRNEGMCSAVFLLMGHGTKTGIHCTDGIVVTTEFIRDKVSGMKYMNGKPKIIFFECSRGVNFAEKVETDQAETNKAIPAKSDVFMVHATTDGNVSYRNQVDGTWFIQMLCEELLENAHVSDLSTMLEQVTGKVGSMAFRKCGQCPVVVKQGISKKMYFLPKCPRLKETFRNVMPDTTSKPMKEANPSQEQLDPEKNYKMDVLRKGHMFILNMGKDRRGSDVDVRNIEHVFMEIGFEIETHSDLTAKELRDKLETFVNSPCNEGMCSAVFLLMGHGSKKGIHCTDNEVVTTEFIRDKVSGMKYMNGKPKIIFFECSRGGDIAERVETDQAGTDETIPAKSDVFMVHATTDGNVSYRSPANGSWFTQMLCEELLENAHVSDLSTMLEQVTGKVGRMASKKYGQCPVVVQQGISKKMYFLPKYPHLKETFRNDDTDNNEGNNDHLTSLKHDSGSNRDDISFDGLLAPPEILARGLRARQAYAEAAQAGTKKVFRTRLMLVGQERVGKTSLKKTLTGQRFDQNEAITDGVETTNAREISIEVAMADGLMWSIHEKGPENEDTKEDEYNKAIADEIAKRLIVTPPQDQESNEPPSETTDSRGVNPVEAGDEYSKACVHETAKRPTMTPPQDQESLGPPSDSTLGRGPNPDAAEEFVSDNVDVPNAKEEDGRVPNQIASLVEKKLKKQGIGTDSNDSPRGEGVSLSIWDFAGHDIYYTTHQVFLTWRAIYVIVFDLSRSLDSVVPPESRDEYCEMAKGGAKSELTCLEFINFWLCSIYAHAVAPSSKTQKSPPIFIVGTHRESVKGDAKEKKKKIDSAFEKIRESIMDKPFECHVVTEYYDIENSLEDKEPKLVKLRKRIDKEAMKEPYMGEDIPIRWLKFEKALAKDKNNYMSLDQTKELMQPDGFESKRDFLTMLTFYHDLGYVVYYGGIEDQQSLLQDMVILKPQWLIDVFKQVITIPHPAERDREVSNAWTTLEKDGILEGRLIQHMWQGFLEKKEALIKLMAKFDLICEVPVKKLQQGQQDGVDTEVSNETEQVVKKRYYVPSRLTSHCPPEEIARINSSTDFYVDFRGFLPDGLFHRLMTRAVRWMGERDGQKVDLFYRHISLMVDKEHHALLEMLPPPKATIKVTVFQGVVDDSPAILPPPAPRAVKEVMDFVTRTLNSLRQHWAKRIHYGVCFLCPICSEKTLFQDCFKQDTLKCGLHTIDTAVIKSTFGIAETSQENTDSTSPRPSASTPVDIPPQGASAAVGEVSTSIAREVSDAMLNKLARQIPSDHYDTFSEKLGIEHNQARNIVVKYQNDYEKATRDCITNWRDRSTRSVADLHGVLRAAELEGLIVYCN